MHKKFKFVKAVGFDLDRTLYADCPEMNRRINDEICLRILGKKPELQNLKRVSDIYTEEWKKAGNWSSVLKAVGFQNPGAVVHGCLETAKVLDFIKKDEELVEIMNLLSTKYFLFLITGSPRNFACRVLQRIGIAPQIFQFTLFGDDENFTVKTIPDSFAYYLSQSSFFPPENVYIGDNPTTDIAIPKSLGMKTIAVGKNIKEADYSVEFIHEIKPLLM